MKRIVIAVLLTLSACTKTTPKPEPVSSETPVPVPSISKGYPVHAGIITTLFWVGEEAGKDNGGIQNISSAWQENWAKHHGCRDTEKKACESKENPYYVALPYNDLVGDKRRKDAMSVIPWAKSRAYKPNESMMKNRWVRVSYQGKTCFGQIEDVGPFLEDDAAYVFGSAQPKNKEIEKAGLDVSPALYQCLGMKGNARTDWTFVDDADVPAGEWKKKITVSQTDW